jgi:hypothetical protein
VGWDVRDALGISEEEVMKQYDKSYLKLLSTTCNLDTILGRLHMIEFASIEERHEFERHIRRAKEMADAALDRATPEEEP